MDGDRLTYEDEKMARQLTWPFMRHTLRSCVDLDWQLLAVWCVLPQEGHDR